MVRTKNRPAADAGHDGVTDDTAKPDDTATPERYDPAVPLHLIDESPINPRKRYDAKALADLAESIRVNGIITPPLLRPREDGRYELAAGHRRCRAARAAGRFHVPAVIREMTDDHFIEVLNVENLQREDIDPLDEALGFEQLLAHGHTAETIANRLGKSTAYVASRLRLVSLGDAAREALQRDYLPLTHAIELAKLTDDQQRELLEELFNLDPELLARARADALNPPESAAGDGPGDAADVTDDDAPDEQDDDREQFEGERRIAHPFGIEHWQDLTVPTVEELRRHIKTSVLRRLKVVPWDLADAELLPEAGACATCEKRTGAAPVLFAEYDTAEDACTDNRCFAAKRGAHLARETARAAAEAAERGDAPAPAKSAKKAAAPQPDWKAEQREREAKKRRAQERKQRGRDAAVSAIVAASRRANLTADTLVCLVSAVLREIHTDALARMLKFFGVDNTPPKGGPGGFGFRLDRMTAWTTAKDRSLQDLIAVLIVASLGDETGVSQYHDRKPERLLGYGKLYRVDVAKIAKAGESATAPAAKPTPAAPAKAAKAAKKVAPKPVKKTAAKKAPAKKAAKKVAKKPAKR